MSDVAGIVLHSILKNPESALELWPKLKIQFFNSDYSQIYVAIAAYYNKYQAIPSYDSLDLVTRELALNNKLAALKLLEVDDDIDLDVAVDALKDQYTQEETLDQLSDFVGKIVTFDSDETKLKLAEIVQHLEEQTDNSEEVCLMNDIFLFDTEELKTRVPLGLNNSFDSATGGMALADLVMIGGRRGSGKTVAGCNIATNQYENKSTSLVFSIEMKNREMFHRYMSILSGVSNEKIKLDRCNREELELVARTRANMFVDSDELYYDYLDHRDYKKFEIDLIQSKKLTSNQIITIDKKLLTIADIDMNINKFKQIHGDTLNTVVVDYVNQIHTTETYDWKSQILLSKHLKDLADKHNVLMVTPYQTDSEGEARFAKGLLDAADIAITLDNKGDYIQFKSTKTRGMKAFEFNAPCEWDSLKILPNDAIVPEEIDTDSSKPIRKSNKEKADDLPWDP